MTAPIDAGRIDAALQSFRDMMGSDGYLLTWQSVGGDRIVVTIDATEDACADCLVPQPVMEAIMSSALAETSVTVERVVLPTGH
ncbi:hypothetical protein [Microbacterium terrisoli]|uniref:hypothetical protein n=1 Tax=Microbacterium terrisoli TaxID=3242192 RepID=UPI0028062F09|nr:hypothetical protein [Microbacterium protaetiae]